MMNELFFPVVVKSKRQWARPDRPGSWGQRRDGAGGGQGGLRRMKSESALRQGDREQGGNSWGGGERRESAGSGVQGNSGNRDWRRSFQPSSSNGGWN
jgi:hypothetical protein